MARGPVPYTLVVAPGGIVVYPQGRRDRSAGSEVGIVSHLGRTY